MDTEIRDSTSPGEGRAGTHTLRGHTPGIQGEAGPGILLVLLPKTRDARAPPEPFPPALPEQTLQLARKQRFLMMGNVRECGASCPAAAEPCRHSWKAQREQHRQRLCGQRAGISAGIHSPIPSTCPLLRLSSLPPAGRGDRRHRGGRSPGLLLV